MLRSSGHLFLLLGLSLGLTACASPRREAGESAEITKVLGGLWRAKTPPAPATDFSSLKAIADSAAAQLPPAYRAEPIEPVSEETPGPPSEIHPGDIFAERDGVRLRKIFSLCEGLDEESRASEMARIASTAQERMPVTLSRQELTEISARLPDDLPFPTRSVALDVRTATHTLDPLRFQTTLESVEKSRKGSPRDEKLRSQWREVKERLSAGEKLHVITAVTESRDLEAVYPGAPVGRRDIDPVRNAVLGAFPHLGEVDAEKVDDRIVVTGKPRLIWEFDSKPFHYDGTRLALAANDTAAP